MVRIFIAVACIGISSVANALVLDMEEQTVASFYDTSLPTKGGYELSTDGIFYVGPGPGVGESWGIGAPGTSNGTLMLAHSSASPFSILSFDALALYGTTPLTVIGYLSRGGQVSTVFNVSGLSGPADSSPAIWNTYSLGAEWQGLTAVEFSSPEIYDLDNIVVSEVPVPAALWLFGSALAGLGWMRRKQTV